MRLSSVCQWGVVFCHKRGKAEFFELLMELVVTAPFFRADPAFGGMQAIKDIAARRLHNGRYVPQNHALVDKRPRHAESHDLGIVF